MEPAGVTLRDAASGKVIATLPRASIFGVLEPINVALAPDGVRVAIVYRDVQLGTNLIVWNTTTGAVATSEPVKRVFPHGLCWSGDGKQVVVLGQSGDARADHWLTILFDASAALVGKPTYSRDRPLKTHASQDGVKLFSWTQARGLIGSDVSGKTVLKFAASDSSVPMSVTITPDGQRVVAACEDRTLRIWDGASGALQTSFGVGGPKATALSLAPANARVVIGYADGSVKLWDLATGLPSVAFAAHGSGVATMQFSRDGHWLITTDDQGIHKIYDAGQPLEK